jgi:purine-binding chemotaxis protein CheW
MDTRDKDQENLVNWDAARDRIAAAKAALESEASPEILERIWAQRATQLAKPPVAEEEGEQIELVQIRLGQEVYGVDAQHVFGIRPAHQITPVPRVPAWIGGVISLSGRILSVLDLRRFFGLEEVADSDDEPVSRFLLIIEAANMEIALLVDEVLEVVTLPESRVSDSSDTVRGIRPEYVSGVAELPQAGITSGQAGLMVVLNIPALVSDEQLVIHEEIN